MTPDLKSESLRGFFVPFDKSPIYSMGFIFRIDTDHPFCGYHCFNVFVSILGVSFWRGSLPGLSTASSLAGKRNSYSCQIPVIVAELWRAPVLFFQCISLPTRRCVSGRSGYPQTMIYTRRHYPWVIQINGGTVSGTFSFITLPFNQNTIVRLCS